MASWDEQFACGNQQQDIRLLFYQSHFKICQQCLSTNTMTCEQFVSGCRHNGDGYGTEVYTCQSCNWSTSYLYDEAGDSYYYEIKQLLQKQLERSQPPKPKVYPEITKDKQQYYVKSLKIIGLDALRHMMLGNGHHPQDIDMFLEEIQQSITTKI